MPEELADLLSELRHVQEAERGAARQVWANEEWVFATRLGGPVSANSDFDEWKALLRAAGVRELRLHDARHSAATMLVVLGVPERSVMGLWAGRAPRWPRGTSM